MWRAGKRRVLVLFSYNREGFLMTELRHDASEVIRFSPRGSQNCAGHQLTMIGCLTELFRNVARTMTVDRAPMRSEVRPGRRWFE